MQKTFRLLALIICALNPTRNNIGYAEFSRIDERIVGETQEGINIGFEDRIDDRVGEQGEGADDYFGKWRYNAEALETKWQEGDPLPPLPFSQLSRSSSYPREITDDERDFDYETRQATRYQQSIDQRGRSRSKADRRIPYFDDYEYEDVLPDRRSAYGRPNERRRRPNRERTKMDTAASSFFNIRDDRFDQRQHTEEEIQLDYGQNVDEEGKELIEYQEKLEKQKDDKSNLSDKQTQRTENHVNSQRNFGEISKEPVSTRYSTFQSRSNEYEQELNDDEEYLRPRPRKRRPPQNYEFALAANEASSRNEKFGNSGLRHPTRGNSTSSRGDSSSNILPGKNESRMIDNAGELKSLLKMQQDEGLSLSELLLRRNLTLDDLLRGKADVISALRAKDVDEFHEVMEQASKVMSNSLAKLVITERPRLTSTVSLEKSTFSENKNKDRDIVTGNTINVVTPSTVTKSTISLLRNSSQSAGNSATEVPLQLTSDSSWSITVEPEIVSSVVTTTTKSQSVVPNSMEIVSGDVELDGNDETRTDSPDEDEIMEFSDFTDFKKTKVNEQSTTSTVRSVESTSSSAIQILNAPKDHPAGSTLSIEQILSPTKRTFTMEESKTKFHNEEKPSMFQKTMGDETETLVENLGNNFTELSEMEYQDDSPVIDSVNSDFEHNTELESVSNEKTLMKEKAEQKAARNKYDEMNDREMMQDRPHSESYDHTPQNHRQFSKTTVKDKKYEDIVSEIEPEVRAEIFELFSSGSNGKKLERLLESRNMSLEELIALRQRGSSKVHLAEVSRIREEQSTTSSQANYQTDEKDTAEKYAKATTESISTTKRLEELEELKKSTSGFNQDEGTTSETQKIQSFDNRDNDDFIYAASFETPDNSQLKVLEDALEENIKISDSKVPRTDNISENPRNFDRKNEESQKNDEKLEARGDVQIEDLLVTFASLPFGKNIQQEFMAKEKGEDRVFHTSSRLPNEDLSFSNEDKQILTNESSNLAHEEDEDDGHVEEVPKQEPEIIDEARELIEEISEKEKIDNEEKKNFSKFKPSIIASGAILGVTIVVFLAILVACRVRQKQKYTYRNTFSRAVFQGPVMAARKLSNSSSLSTVMVNVVATSTTKRPDRNDVQDTSDDFEPKSDIDNDSLDANDSWETIPDYMK